MIKELTFEGYRSFSKKTSVPLKKLTLLFGPNSSGKTSIISALSLLRQSVEDHGSTPGLVLRGRAGLTDLGTYRDIVSDGRLDRRLEIGVLFTEASGLGQRRSYPWNSSELQKAVRLKGWERLLFGRNDSTMGLRAQWEYNSEFKWLRAKMISLHAGEFDRELLRFSSGDTSIPNVCQLSKIEAGSDLWREEFEFYTTYAGQNSEKDLANRWEEAVAALFGMEYGKGKLREFRNRMAHGRPQSKGANVPSGAVEFYSLGLRVVNAIERRDLGEFVSAKQDQWKWGLFDLHRFLPGSPLFVDETFDALPYKGFDQAVRTACGIPESAEFFNIPEAISSISSRLRDHLSSVEPLGPLRGTPKRFYAGKEVELGGVGYKGEDVAEYLAQNSDLVEKVNEWMQRLGSGHAVRPQVVADGRGVALMLKDLHRSDEVEVTFADVGFGISQSLPIVVQCLSSTGKLITIEQPEVHIHPRLQSNIADLFVEAVENGNQCVIETHSEHLVLRLLRRIREGSFDSEDLQVLYVKRGEDGSEITPIEISSKGELLTEWPGGFFEERLDELF